MKICPECHTENPHKAKRCMNCGAMLVDENDLSVEEQLRLKLIEAEKKISRLENALDDAQKRIAQLEHNGNAPKEVVVPDVSLKKEKEPSTCSGLISFVDLCNSR